MNSKLKTLLVLTGTVLLAVPAIQAQHSASAVSARPSIGSRSAFAGRPAQSRSAFGPRGAYTNGRSIRGGGYYNGHGHGYGRYYYLGGIPYFYPFYGYGYGFGFPAYYGDGFYGDGFYGPYGSAGAGYADRANPGDDRDHGRSANGNSNGNNQDTGNSLPAAVQRQLSKRGYYKGTVDGEFGPASRSALSRFQKSQGLKETGRIDEDTLDALGFTDQR